jgi:hypothetical protein
MGGGATTTSSRATTPPSSSRRTAGRTRTAQPSRRPPPMRRGYFIGDGTGAGKGRQIAGVITDNWNQGRQEARLGQPEAEPAGRRPAATGGTWATTPGTSSTSTRSATRETPPAEGVAFITYDTLKGRPKDPKPRRTSTSWSPGWARTSTGCRLRRGARHGERAWTPRRPRGEERQPEGPGRDRSCRRCCPRPAWSTSRPPGRPRWQPGLRRAAGVWGRGTPFATKQDFISEMNKGGVAAMEAVAQSPQGDGRLRRPVAVVRRRDGEGQGHLRPADAQAQPRAAEMYDAWPTAGRRCSSNIDKALE